MTTPVVPIVHLNGTSKDELLQLREKVYVALTDLLFDLKQMAPNRRDYYIGPDELWERALEQHRRRMQTITDMMKEIEIECEKVEEQGRVTS